MRVSRLDDMKRGWFVGPFEPTLLATDDVEVAVKFYDAGECEERHVHHVATEVTALISGRARMAGRELGAGDVAVLEPGEPSDFLALTDVVLVAVKTPAVPGDKHPVEG
jgi:mannose-6-phosphate isomerase-like protein (cupin superfamily)